jgi:phage FluMu protein Com
MVKCPKCHEKIDRLNEIRPPETRTVIFRDESLEYDPIYSDMVMDYDYRCPECDEVIAEGWEEAESLASEDD